MDRVMGDDGCCEGQSDGVMMDGVMDREMG